MKTCLLLGLCLLLPIQVDSSQAVNPKLEKQLPTGYNPTDLGCSTALQGLGFYSTTKIKQSNHQQHRPHLHRFPSKDEEVLCSHHHEAHKFMA